MKISSLLALFGLMIAIVSCDSGSQEIELPPLDQGEIWDCHQEKGWDEQAIRDELIGDWKWVYSMSYWAPDEGRNTEKEEMRIKFSSDSTLTVNIDGSIQLITQWSLAQEDGSLFGVEMESAVEQLHGRILLCDNLLEFNNSYIDGADNYFVR